MNDAQGAASPWIVEATAESFEDDVFARSLETAVVVDFWAPWCGPCRALGPILEKLAIESDGRFTLVKANTDELPQAAAQFQVQGIPAIFGVLDRQIVDYFTGALPEPQIREWLERLISAGMLAEAERLEDASPGAAEARYRTLVEQHPGDPRHKIGLARVLFALDKFDEARAVIDQLAERGFLEPEAEKVKAKLDLHQMGDTSLAERQAAAAADPDDLQRQLELAEALAGAGQHEQALQVCLTLVPRDRAGVGEQARQLMIEIFRALPDDSPLTQDYRRKLSLTLY